VCDTDHERRVEDRVQALLTSVGENPPVKLRPCDVSKEIRSLKLRKDRGVDDIPKECLRHFPRRSLVQTTHLFNLCLRLFHFPAFWKDARIIGLSKAGKNPKFPNNLRSISLVSTMGKHFEKLNLNTIHRFTAERNLLNASQFGFRARHSNV
jgi:hypothetical protein